jgi:hypothetical protein
MGGLLHLVEARNMRRSPVGLRSIQHQGAKRALVDLYDLLSLRRPVKISGTDNQTPTCGSCKGGLFGAVDLPSTTGDRDFQDVVIGIHVTGDGFLFT